MTPTDPAGQNTVKLRDLEELTALELEAIYRGDSEALAHAGSYECPAAVAELEARAGRDDGRQGDAAREALERIYSDTAPSYEPSCERCGDEPAATCECDATETADVQHLNATLEELDEDLGLYHPSEVPDGFHTSRLAELDRRAQQADEPEAGQAAFIADNHRRRARNARIAELEEIEDRGIDETAELQRLEAERDAAPAPLEEAAGDPDDPRAAQLGPLESIGYLQVSGTIKQGAGAIESLAPVLIDAVVDRIERARGMARLQGNRQAEDAIGIDLEVAKAARKFRQELKKIAERAGARQALLGDAQAGPAIHARPNGKSPR